eukprot:Skav208786  [mRNA]  locus=scaffold931:204460:215795:- [translate_table: standard]
MLKKQETGDRCGLTLLGHPVCQRSWRLLLGVGKARFRRLRAAILAGAEICPLDLRYTPRKNKIIPSSDSVRVKIHEWLLTAYHQMAEPLPEGVTDLSLGKTAEKDTSGPLKRRGRRPRSYVKHQEERSGHHRDAWEEGFGSTLFIRPRSQHKSCSTCIRHKLLIAKLGADEEARRQQLLMYRRHLDRQYRDRMAYWSSRTLSRLGPQSSGDRTVVITLDSMDHAKYSYPKGLALQSKDFNSFIRPCLTCTAAIIHGYATIIVLAEPYVHQTSSWTCEILAHCMHLLAQDPTVDLKRYEVIAFGDNSSKELKNNAVLRLLSGLTASRRIRRAELRTLQSGHSHEDLDQTFSILSSFLSSQSELSTPSDYRQAIEDWLRCPSVRPLEPRKHVYLVNQEVLHRICGAWLGALAALKKRLPDDFFQKEKPGLDQALQTEMAALKLKECQVLITQDVQDMEQHAIEKQKQANLEGHLDLKFLNARYEKGVRQVETYMGSNHKYVEADDLTQLQPDVLRFMHGNDAAFGTHGKMMMIPAVVQDLHGASNLEGQKSAIDSWNSKYASSAAVAATATTPPGRGERPRTGAKPEFDDTDQPLDVHQEWIFQESSVLPQLKLEQDFELLVF